MRLYVETSPVIYAVQNVPPFAVSVNGRLAAAGVIIVSSELARLECLVQPLRNNDAGLIANFDQWSSLQVAEMVSFAPAVFRRAAEIRAAHNFKTPDALHLAAAVLGRCSAFLTNDARLARFPDLAVEVV